MSVKAIYVSLDASVGSGDSGGSDGDSGDNGVINDGYTNSPCKM